MRTLTTLLIVLGALALVYGGFTYTKKEHKADIGPVELKVKEKERVELPPLVGGAVLAGGAVLLALSIRRRRGSAI